MKKLLFSTVLLLITSQLYASAQQSVTAANQHISSQQTTNTIGTLEIYLIGCFASLLLALYTRPYNKPVLIYLILSLGSWISVLALIATIVVVVWVCINDDHPYQTNTNKKGYKTKMHHFVQSSLMYRTIKNT